MSVTKFHAMTPLAVSASPFHVDKLGVSRDALLIQFESLTESH